MGSLKLISSYKSPQYYSLPFCSGKDGEKKGEQKRHTQDLGETLSGSHKINTPYDVTYLDLIPWRKLCEEFLEAKDVSNSKRYGELSL